VKDKYEKICEESYLNARKETHIKYKDWLDSPWSGFFEGKDPLKVSPTGVKEDTLVHIGKKMSSPPPNAAEFIIHKGEFCYVKGAQEWSLSDSYLMILQLCKFLKCLVIWLTF